jgi:hypothetical protein
MEPRRPSFRPACVLFCWLCIGAADQTIVIHVRAEPPAPVQTPTQKPALEDTDADKKPDADNDQAKNTPAKPESDESRCLAELDKLEIDLSSAERFGVYGDEAVSQIAQELRDEYLDNQSVIESYGDSPSDVKEVGRLGTRQSLIKVYLWQLKNVGGQIARAKRAEDSGLRGISEIVRRFPGMMQNVKIRDRFNELNQREYKLLRLKMGGHGPIPFQILDPIEELALTKEQQSQDTMLPLGRNGQAGQPGEDVISRLKEPIGMLIKLDWRNDGIFWDRKHWETPFGGKSLVEIQNEVNEMLTQRGIEIPAPTPGFQARVGSEPPGLLLFENLQSRAGGNASGFAFSGNQSGFEKQFSNGQMSASFRSMTQNYDLQIQESPAPSRLLKIKSKTEQDLRLLLIDDENTLVIDQSPTGQVTLVQVAGSETFSVSGNSFAEVYRNHRAKIESDVFPRLMNMGIQISPVTFE